MIGNKGWRIAAMILAVLLASESATARRPHQQHRAAAARSGPRPALWLLEDNDTHIYLFGTYHILPHGFRWRTRRFDAIARSADELVVEVADVGAPDIGAEAMAEIQLGKTAPILWRVSPERRQALQDMVDDLGVPMERLDDLQTWAVAMGLAAAQIVRGMAASDDGRDAGEEESTSQAAPSVSRFPGVEGPLEAEFRASHRPVSGVETATQQMRFFRVLSFAEQREFLEGVVDAYSAGTDVHFEGDIGQRDWARGNVAAIARQTEAMRGPLYDVLLRGRNQVWTDWLVRRLNRPGTLLFAVGAGHLAGDDSVLAMLAARGFRTRRIQ
jgi:hypothetical protein